MREYRIGRLNGRFVVTWIEPDGRRRRYRLDALTRKAAETEALDVIAKQNLPKAGATVADLWGQYQAYLGDRPAGVTMSYTGKAVLAHFGDMRPDQVTLAQCNAYSAARMKAGKSQGTVHTELGHLRSTLTWAVKIGVIDRAPHVFRPHKPAPKDRFLDQAEIDRLLSADCEPHVRLAIILMLTTGARIGAALELTWDRVDLSRGQIDLRLDAEGPRKGRAVVPINGTLRAALVSAKQAALSEHVVEWAGGQVKSIRKGFERAVNNAGLTGVSPHVLRHTAGVHMAAGGVPMHKISQYLGHSNTAVTERVYARFAPDHMRDAADVLDFGKLRKVRDA
jgi:integrase